MDDKDRWEPIQKVIAAVLVISIIWLVIEILALIINNWKGI